MVKHEPRHALESELSDRSRIYKAFAAGLAIALAASLTANYLLLKQNTGLIEENNKFLQEQLDQERQRGEELEEEWNRRNQPDTTIPKPKLNDEPLET
jgi:hypothetical protein